MSLGLFLLLGVVAFLWMLGRVLKGINKRFLFWLAWTFGGLCLVLTLHAPLVPLTQAIVWLWEGGVVVLPCWWLGRRMYNQYWGRG